MIKRIVGWTGPVGTAAALFACLLWPAGCSLDVGADLSGLGGGLGDALDDIGSSVENILEDPFGNNPGPVLVGGDRERVLYATNIGDIEIRFRGRTNDIVIPGYLGPSNVYQFRDKKRELLRPLVFSGSFLGLTTDGEDLAYISVSEAGGGFPKAVWVGALGGLTQTAVFDEREDENLLLVSGQIALDRGRVAFLVDDLEAGTTTLRVVDTREAGGDREFIADVIGQFRFKGDRLAFLQRSAADGTVQLVLVNLALDEAKILAPDIRAEFVDEVALFLTDNAVVWAEPSAADLFRVSRYDVPTAVTRVWSDAVEGRLAGASDDFFVTEQFIERFPDAANQITVRRYNGEGAVKTLATFRADGLAGQAMLLGDRAAWVNDDKEIVLAPLSGGERTIFAPFKR